MSVKQNLFVSVFVRKCLMMLNDAEYTTFKMVVTQMSNYLFVISFQLMFYKTLRSRPTTSALPGPLRPLVRWPGTDIFNLFFLRVVGFKTYDFIFYES